MGCPRPGHPFASSATTASPARVDPMTNSRKALRRHSEMARICIERMEAIRKDWDIRQGQGGRVFDAAAKIVQVRDGSTASTNTHRQSGHSQSWSQGHVYASRRSHASSSVDRLSPGTLRHQFSIACSQVHVLVPATLAIHQDRRGRILPALADPCGLLLVCRQRCSQRASNLAQDRIWNVCWRQQKKIDSKC